MKHPDEILFYVGTYGPADQPSIHLCALNIKDGEMRRIGGTAGIENPSYITLDSRQHVLYAVSEKGSGEAAAFSVDAETMELAPLGSRATEGADPCYVSVSQDGGHVLVSNYSGGNINAYPVNPDGSLGEMTSNVRHQGAGVRPDRQEGPHPHSINPEPGSAWIMVCDLGLDRIMLYRLEDGKLVLQREVSLPEGAGPRHLTFHPDGKRVYCINELNNTVTVFTYDAVAGTLEALQHVPTLPEHYVPGSDDTAADIHVSPCGRFLYASNRGHDSVALFHIDSETGLLTAADWQITGGRTPRNFAICQGWLLAANQGSDNITSFRIDAESRRLIPTGNELGISSPVCIAPVN